MLAIIALVLLVLWGVALATAHLFGGAIHLLAIIGLAMLIVHLFHGLKRNVIHRT